MPAVETEKRLVGFAEALAPAQVLDGARRATVVALQESQDAEQGGETRRFAPDAGVAHEERALARALAAVPPEIAPADVGHIGAIELADAVVGEAGPAADRARARLVP